MAGMQRVVVMVSGLALGVLAGVICFLSWDRANQVAGTVSAFVGIASLGVALWATVSATPPASGISVVVSDTGKASARDGGSANTGAVIPSSLDGPTRLEVRDTAEADAEGGQSNTGIAPQ
ncbi:hypothetical protein ACIPX0_03385 [Streptomyces sp. NPDC090075]|uniref:hypothetical protein n=1 Tax=unclassified Streptomyces TaxID=2593676 RepID=UPI0037F98C63